MAWNGNYTIFYGYNHCPELNSQMDTPPPLPTLNTSSCGGRSGINNSPLQERKKRLSTDQIESLERSFQEEIKLEPDRKMRLARELGLQPRQVAVWFQNRRARWKTKQLELVYGALKHEFDAVTKEKQKLQEEVVKLRGQLQKKSRVETKQGSTTCHTDATSAEETVESNAVVICSGCDNKLQGSSCHQTDDCNYLFHGDCDDYDSSLHNYWGVFPTYPWG